MSDDPIKAASREPGQGTVVIRVLGGLWRAIKWLGRILTHRFFICPLLLVVGIVGVLIGQAILLKLGEDELLLFGAGVFLVLVIVPFLFKTTEKTTFYRKVEMAALLGGGLIAVVTAGFLLNEYKHQRQARVTSAWDLLHKAREQADLRMDAELAKEIEKRQIAAATARAIWEECIQLKDADCQGEFEKSQGAENDLAELTNGNEAAVWSVRRRARGGNDGQIEAIETLHQTREVNLQGLVVDELYLKYLQLPGENLAAASFRYADLRGAKLGGAYLARANLRGADLWHADLRSTDLVRADLGGANLVQADMVGAYLGDANMGGAMLQLADLGAAGLVRAYLVRADLRYANLEGAILTEADLESATLEGAMLTGANLRGANLEGAKFSKHPKELGAVWPDHSPPRNLNKIVILE